MKKTFAIGLLVFVALTIQAQEPFWLGADISGTTELEAKGKQLRNAKGEPRENTALMRELGLNAVRLRVWVNPVEHGNFCNKEDVVRMALRAKDWGMALMIDFHYSDWWADPGQQNIPAQWKSMSYEEMKQALANHTREVLEAIKEAGVEVRWVQVGNETTHGFLWPVGRAEENMRQYAGLTDAGYQAVKAVYPKAIVIIHLDGGCDPKRYDFIFDGLKKYKARFDMIGLSVYPYWDVKVEVKKPVEGKQIMSAIIHASKNNTNGHCKGVFYWAPELEGQYPLGAFQDGKPTIIMDAFIEIIWLFAFLFVPLHPYCL